MASADDLLPVIDQIYEAATDPLGLERLALVIARVLRTESGFLAFNAMPEPGTSQLPAIIGLPSTTCNFDDWARKAYAEYYHERNIWYREGCKKGMPTVVIGGELVDERTLLRSEWYDYCQKFDAFHVLGCQFLISETVSGQFGAHRPRGAPEFGNGDRKIMERLLPHLQRAVQVHTRLNLAQRATEFSLEALSDLQVATICVTAQRKLIFANKQGEKTLEHGGWLTVSRGAVQVSDLAQSRNFERLVADAAQMSSGEGNAAGGLLTVKNRLGLSTCMLVSPFRALAAGFGPALPAAVLMFSDSASMPGEHEQPEKILIKAFGLTPAEARLASALGAGETLADYANRTVVSINTAKTHLRKVLLKTGCSRQALLMQLLSQNAAIRLAIARRSP